MVSFRERCLRSRKRTATSRHSGTEYQTLNTTRQDSARDSFQENSAQNRSQSDQRDEIPTGRMGRSSSPSDNGFGAELQGDRSNIPTRAMKSTSFSHAAANGSEREPPRSRHGIQDMEMSTQFDPSNPLDPLVPGSSSVNPTRGFAEAAAVHATALPTLSRELLQPSPSHSTSITRFIYDKLTIPRWSPRNDSPSHQIELEMRKLVDEINQLRSEKEGWTSSNRDLQSRLDNLETQVRDLKHNAEKATRDIEGKNQELESMRKTQVKMEKESRELIEKVKDLEYERDTAQDGRNDAIRKQQEQSFKALESGRWIPQEESKVKDDLESLKRLMKTWARNAATTFPTPWKSLNDSDAARLSLVLPKIVWSKDGHMPRGLSIPKGSSLLLNALLARHVYAKIFSAPFFGLHKDGGDALQLKSTYDSILFYDEVEAHKWRSQTLRLLYPPLRQDLTEEGVRMHSITHNAINQTASLLADDFLAGPASCFITTQPEPTLDDDLNHIYRQAAELSYQIWTRKIGFRADTELPLEPLPFDAEDPRLNPHPSVKYDDHDDQLKGKPVELLVHPLVQVYGTDDGEEYDKGRIWMPAEVWLESKVEPKDGYAKDKDSKKDT